MSKPSPSSPKVIAPSATPSAAKADAHAPAVASPELVRVYNKGEGSFIHTIAPVMKDGVEIEPGHEYRVGPNAFADVPQHVADIWGSHLSNGEPRVVLASTMSTSKPVDNSAELKKKDSLLADQEAKLSNLEGILAKLRAAAQPGETDEQLFARLAGGKQA